MSNFEENMAFVSSWAETTTKVLASARKRMRIGDSGDLEKSFGYSVRSSGAKIIVEFYFLARGRFVDMGAGRKPTSNSPYAQPKGRKPKKWYSKKLYGRLNSLNEALSTSVAEQVLNVNTEVFKQRKSGSFQLIII